MIYEFLFRASLAFFLFNFILLGMHVMAFKDPHLQKKYDKKSKQLNRIAIILLVLGVLAYGIQNA